MIYAWIIYEDVLDPLENHMAAAHTQKVVGVALTEEDAARAVAAGGTHEASSWPPIKQGAPKRAYVKVPIVG